MPNVNIGEASTPWIFVQEGYIIIKSQMGQIFYELKIDSRRTVWFLVSVHQYRAIFSNVTSVISSSQIRSIGVNAQPSEAKMKKPTPIPKASTLSHFGLCLSEMTYRKQR